MKKLILIISIFCYQSLFAAVTAEFQGGNDLVAHDIVGDVRVHCREDNRSYYHRCSSNILMPSNFSRLYTSEKVDANRYKIQATWEDGKVVSKKGRYSSEDSRTTYINLWTITLFQRPLLDYGVNQVEWSLEKKGSEKASGTIEVNVSKGEQLNCGSGSIWMNTQSSCRNSSSACSAFFNQYNYCQQ